MREKMLVAAMAVMLVGGFGSFSFADEMKKMEGEAKGKAAEMEGKAKGKAAETEGKAKGKAAEMEGKAKGK